jgi:hypothetical protein
VALAWADAGLGAGRRPAGVHRRGDGGGLHRVLSLRRLRLGGGRALRRLGGELGRLVAASPIAIPTAVRLCPAVYAADVSEQILVCGVATGAYGGIGSLTDDCRKVI